MVDAITETDEKARGAKYGGVSGEHLRQFVERIERLEEEKRALGDHIKDAFAECKATGFDVKTIKKIIRLRKLDQSDRDEQQYLLETYQRALGMLPLFEAADEKEAA